MEKKVLTKEEKHIALLSGHIYATRGALGMGNVAGAEQWLNMAIEDIEEYEKDTN